MRKFLIPLIIFLFNYTLFNCFMYGEGGSGLYVIITVPIIIILTSIFAFIAYYRGRQKKPLLIFEIISIIFLSVLSYYFFPTNLRPISVVKKMASIAIHKNQIIINDYFLDDLDENCLKIVAAKKKFKRQLSDTTYSVKISYKYQSNMMGLSFGIIFNPYEKPAITDKTVLFNQYKDGTVTFVKTFSKDTVTIYGTKDELSVIDMKTDSVSEYGNEHVKDTILKRVDIRKIIKSQTADNNYFAYKIFYWII